MNIFNSMSRKKEEFVPVHEGKVGIYACGPTVYDYFHIGNARPFITFDVLRRQLEREGYDVTFVQNFTDIDDKMIRRANEEGITVKELADRFIAEYYQDAKALGIHPATVHPRATDHIDEIIHIIRTSENDEEAISRMKESFGLSDIQSKSILDMQMRRLTGLQRRRIEEEYDSLVIAIADYRDILARHDRVLGIIKDELAEMKSKYNDKRRTEIVEAASDIDDADLIPVENVMIAITTNGYIKRTTVDTYKTQNRGGKGVKGMSLNSDDIIDQVLTMSSHDDLLLFTSLGKVYRIKGFNVPAASRVSKGVPVVNLLNLQPQEKVVAMIDVIPGPELEDKYMFFVTKQGLVKRVPMSEFLSIRQSGKIAISLREDDELFGARITSGDDEIIIAGDNGKAIRFNEQDVRPMGRNASGVKGFNADGSVVVGMATNKMGEYILAVTEKGYGKKIINYCFDETKIQSAF